MTKMAEFKAMFQGLPNVKGGKRAIFTQGNPMYQNGTQAANTGPTPAISAAKKGGDRKVFEGGATMASVSPATKAIQRRLHGAATKGAKRSSIASNLGQTATKELRAKKGLRKKAGVPQGFASPTRRAALARRLAR